MMTNEEKEVLIAQGWTPPKPSDVDLAQAQKCARDYALRDAVRPQTYEEATRHFLTAIKIGRVLQQSEAEPGMVWVKHDGSAMCPVEATEEVLIQYGGGQRSHRVMAGMVNWENVTHYAIVTPPETLI